jgi:hypothetical protein
MSDFARGVVGVFVVGMVAGAGALMFIPKSSPSANQVANVPTPACAQHAPHKNDAACPKTAAQHRNDANANKDAAPERVLSSANSVAANGRTAAGLVTVDAQAIAALRRGESLQPDPAAEPAPEAAAAAPQPAVAPTTTAAAAQAVVPAVTGAVARQAARRAPQARRTARQNSAYRAYASTRSRGFAMGFPFFPTFR